MKIDISNGTNINGLIDMLSDGLASGKYNPNESMEISIDPKILQDKEFLRFCLKAVLTSTVLSRKDYFLVSKLYREMNLFDNKKLLEALKNYKKGNRYYGNNKTALKGISFSEAVYEDILYLAVDEVVDKNNDIVYKEILNYISKCFAEGLMPLNNQYLVYAIIFIENYKETKEVPDKIYASHLTMAYKFYNESKTVHDFKYDNFSKNLEKQIEVSNITKVPSYNQMIIRAMNDICKFLDVRNEKEFFDLIRGSMSYDHAPIPNPKAAIFTELADIFSIELSNAGYGNNLIGETAPNLTDSYLKEIFITVLNSEAMEQLYNKCTDNFKMVQIENIPAFLSRMAFIIYENVLLESIKDLMQNYYKNFSFDKVENVETIKELNKKVFTLNSQVLDLKARYDKQKEKCDILDRKIRSKQKDEDRIFLERISKLEKKNDILEEENKKLNEKIKIQEEYLKLLEMPEEQEDIKEVNLQDLLLNKYLFVGGRPEVITTLKQKFSNSFFTSNETENINLVNVNYIVMFTKWMSHALYYKYINAARELGIKVIYVSNNNIDMVIQKISNEINL